VLRYGTQSWQELSVDVESPSTKKKQVVAGMETSDSRNE
jgi:hypothetical protein